MFESIQESFQSLFHSKPEVVVRAPGRVNLIGEHTDYNDGFVLPMAIDRSVWIALRPRSDRRVLVHSLDFNVRGEFDLDRLERGLGWLEYLKGVANELQIAGYPLHGWEGVMSADVPRDAGLSSSAAVEMATARAFSALSGFALDAMRMAAVGQRAASEWVGVRGGIMDEAVSAAAKAGHAFFLDCRTLVYEHIPVPKDAAVVIMDTSTRRGLVDSAYNKRRQECEAAARFFGVQALRDVSLEMLGTTGIGLDKVALQRARHVVTENERVLRAVQAMRAGDTSALGGLFNASHASLRDDFEVTNDALNWIVEIAQAQPECYGARMTGAGFGGCAVALVRQDSTQEFEAAVRAGYKRKSGMDAVVYVCRASDGATSIKL